jgi:hypothetical protein
MRRYYSYNQRDTKYTCGRCGGRKDTYLRYCPKCEPEKDKYIKIFLWTPFLLFLLGLLIYGLITKDWNGAWVILQKVAGAKKLNS